MNPLLLRLILVFFTNKNDIKLILVVFLFVLLLPVMTVLVIANTGIPAISNELVKANTTTHQIQIHDPTGKLVAMIDASTTWPVPGMVTLEFGENDLPYQPFHTGIDIADKSGDPVTTFMKGTVIETTSLSWGYGNYVVIDHGNNITSLYGHLSEIDVTKGQSVQPGDVIGKEGQTGWATGPHVHFEIRVFGIPVNPRTFVEGNP